MSIYDYTVKKGNGEELSLAEYKGKVLLIVNTATGCGFTPQYKDLEEYYQAFHDKGFEVIDIPCNQFAGQAPETDGEIHAMCARRFGTSYEQMAKAEVNGKNALPLYGYLKAEQGFHGFGDVPMAKAMDEMLLKIDKDYASKPDIKWNFTKFLVDKNGKVVKRFEPTDDLAEVRASIAALLD